MMFQAKLLRTRTPMGGRLRTGLYNQPKSLEHVELFTSTILHSGLPGEGAISMMILNRLWGMLTLTSPRVPMFTRPTGLIYNRLT